MTPLFSRPVMGQLIEGSSKAVHQTVRDMWFSKSPGLGCNVLLFCHDRTRLSAVKHRWPSQGVVQPCSDMAHLAVLATFVLHKFLRFDLRGFGLSCTEFQNLT